MATTVNAPVANQIASAINYVPYLDEVYKAESKTAILDTASDQVRFTGANTVEFFTLDTVGMANYDRNAGFVPGDVNGAWVPYQLQTDRGRSYMLDVMDNEEALGLPVSSLLNTVQRQHIIPEIDAYRFAQYASGALSSQQISGTIATGTAMVDAIDDATSTLDDAEVPYEGRLLFVSSQGYKFLKKGITRYTFNGENGIDYNVEIYNDMRVISVPQSRFQTAITLANPTTSAGAGGFAPATGAANINFMIIHPTAVLQVMKYFNPRLFAPSQNPEADAWLVQPRFYHGAFVKTRKTNGIYVHHA